LYQDVKVNVCWIPFGGYVKIAGMEKEKKGEVKQEDGFFEKNPLSRIYVAVSGPLTNIIFALFAFSLIWMSGGREKSFSDVSSRVGWIDTKSQLYAKGVRPGDKILSYNGKAVKTSKDHLYAAMTSGPVLRVEVEKLGVSSQPGRVTTIEVAPYQHPLAFEKDILTTGVLAPAGFLVWEELVASPEAGKMLPQGTDIVSGDRLVWMDGEPLFSHMQLNALLNNGLQFITVIRKDSYINVNVSRTLVGEMKIPSDMKGELSDWQYEGKLSGVKLNDLWFIPYNITSDGVVESAVSFLEQKNREESQAEKLLPGDRIVAIGGELVSSGAEILREMQQKRSLLVVERDGKEKSLVFDKADASYTATYHSHELLELVESIGTDHALKQQGNFVLLQPIIPRTRMQLLEESGRKAEAISLKEEEVKSLQAIEDPQMRSKAEETLFIRDKQLFLGLFGVHDRGVLFNPNPFEICAQVCKEVYDTVSALFGGYLSPKWMSGPVGIFHVIQQQWTIGYKEALFWLGTISLNLAILNLLPLPVLDGGYIMLSLFEIITGVRLKVTTIEKIVFPTRWHLWGMFLIRKI
jgi:regulator of sigma E protease